MLAYLEMDFLESLLLRWSFRKTPISVELDIGFLENGLSRKYVTLEIAFFESLASRNAIYLENRSSFLGNYSSWHADF